MGLPHPASLPVTQSVSQAVIRLPIQSVNQLVELQLEFNTKQETLITLSATQDNERKQGSLPAHTGKQTHYTQTSIFVFI